MWKCKHCKNNFDFNTTSEKANHTRWCEANPKRNDTNALRDAQKRVIENKYGALQEFSVTCFRCSTLLLVKEREYQHPKKKRYFCSRNCANHRGSGLEWAAARGVELSMYQTICFAHHAKKCIVCEEERIIEVHHLDENSTNNNPENLVPLCPTHHQYWHSRHRLIIENDVLNYISEWKRKRDLS